MNTTVAPRIYVADLAAYNAGNLVGQWIDLEDGGGLDHDDFVEWLHAVIQGEILQPTHEEWAIHDFEGFGPIRIGEYDSLATIVGHVQRMGDDPARYFAYVEAHGVNYADQYAEEKVSGPYGSAGDWFDEYLSDFYGSVSVEDILVTAGVDPRVADTLSDYLTFITADQFELMMSANNGVSFVQVGDQHYAVGE